MAKSKLFYTTKENDNGEVAIKISWLKIGLWLVVIAIAYFTYQQYSASTTVLTDGTVVPADTTPLPATPDSANTPVLPAPADSTITDSSTVTAPDSSATAQPKLTLAEQQRQARLAKQAAKKAFFKKMDAAKKAKNDARVKFEMKNK